MQKTADKTAFRLLQGLGDRLGSALIAAAIGGSLAMAILGALEISVTALQAYGAAFAVGALLALACSSPLLALGALLCVGAGAIGLYRAGLTPWQDLMAMLDAMIAGDAPLMQVLRTYPALTIALSAIFLGGVSYALARMQGGAYPLLALMLTVFLAAWYLAEQVFALEMALSLFAIAAMLARSRDLFIPWRKILPFALIAALVAGVCLPAPGTVWPPLQNAAQNVRDLITDYFNFTSPRSSYTVATDGFQPMGERLGGPANPLTHEILEIETDSRVLLRGSIKRAYTGYSWIDDGVNNRYLYVGMGKNALKNELFSADLASRADISGAFDETEIAVRFLNEGSSSLFVPNIVKDLRAPIELAVYFNDTGEIFLTRDVAMGDSYVSEGLSPVHGSAMAAFLEKTVQISDENYDAIRAEYTRLPEGIEQGVYALAQKVVSGAQSPYEAAYLLASFLRSGEYAYETEVDYPPYGSDFVSYFLLHSKQGYCTYFATAMAVMARMVGLPSRYVEGYLVEPEGDVTIVTGDSAHAWVEIYFRGAGWIAFDPTPGEGEGQGARGGDSDEPMETPEPSPTPEPTQEPSPEPTLPPDGDTIENPEQDPEHEPLLTPEPTPTILPQEQPTPGADDKPKRDWVWKTLLALSLLAMIALAVLWREKMTRPAEIARREKSNSNRLLIWYRAILDLLCVCNMEPQPGETPIATARRIAATPGDWSAFVQLSEVVAVCRYSGGEPNDSAIALAGEAYNQVLSQMPRRVQLQWLAKRMVRGLRPWQQIP